MERAVNPDPHDKGYRFTPIHRVTAIFESCNPVGRALQSLHDAGFSAEEIEVFVGTAGAEKLDLSGKHHGVVVQAMRVLKMLVADETELHQQVDQALRRGGSAINVFTADDEEKKKRAAEILKACNASNVCYWGRWGNERLFNGVWLRRLRRRSRSLRGFTNDPMTTTERPEPSAGETDAEPIQGHCL